MWLLINVDESSDVGNNERRRFLVHDDIVIEHVSYAGSTVHIVANVCEVHQATTQCEKYRTIEDILQHCAKMRGVHGLSWRTMHEFFWFVSACHWGYNESYTDEGHDVYNNYKGRVGEDVSFDKMLRDWVLLFGEYCEDEYGGDE